MQAFPFDSQISFDEVTGDPIYDRAVSSQPLRKLIRDLFTTGVMPNPSTCFQVMAGTGGMTVQAQPGYAVVDGGLCREDEIRTLEVTASDSTYDRIDTVILRWNENVDVRTADLYIKAGTPSANPVRPELQRNNSIYEIGLADVFITKRVATITNDKITDTRLESARCGIVSSVSEWDTTTIYQQIQADLAGFKSTEEAEFMSWFESIQDILDENVAAHLQNEIGDLAELETTDKTDLVGAINENKTNIDTLGNIKQDKTDNALVTTAKTIVGAINELLGKFANYFTKTEINAKVQTNVPANAVFTDTTTGTSYGAGAVPENSTFATNASLKYAYDASVASDTNIWNTLNRNKLGRNTRIGDLGIIGTLLTSKIDTTTIAIPRSVYPNQGNEYPISTLSVDYLNGHRVLLIRWVAQGTEHTSYVNIVDIQ